MSVVKEVRKMRVVGFLKLHIELIMPTPLKWPDFEYNECDVVNKYTIVSLRFFTPIIVS